MQHSVRYIVMFAAMVCVVCSIFVSSAAVLLKDRQEENRVLDRQSKVLAVAGLLTEGRAMTGDEIKATYQQYIKPQVVALKTGELAAGVDAAMFDQRKAQSNPNESVVAPANDAQVARIPNQAVVYLLQREGETEAIILPVEGKGLWSTLYGYLALEKDARTIKGITFYQHGETPGLGGEVENPNWVALWPGRKAFDENWEPKIAVKKGQAGPPERDPYNVDGLSGSTLTSRGVTNLLRFWLGEHGFGPYLEKYRQQKGIQ